jgi:hypothetical protein
VELSTEVFVSNESLTNTFSPDVRISTHKLRCIWKSELKVKKSHELSNFIQNIVEIPFVARNAPAPGPDWDPKPDPWNWTKREPAV